MPWDTHNVEQGRQAAGKIKSERSRRVPNIGDDNAVSLITIETILGKEEEKGCYHPYQAELAYLRVRIQAWVNIE